MNGPLQLNAFRGAWQALMQRHAVLRSAFLWEELDDAYQVVQQDVDLPLTELDWQDRADPQAALEQLGLEQRAQPLELNESPLMRVCLVRLAPERWHLIWTFHHILMDGWSVGIAVQEWLALYYEQAHGRPAHLPPTRAYRDYIAWLAEQDMAATEGFWREQLQDLSEPTPLPNFAVREAAPAGAPFAERESLLDDSETEQLSRFARRHDLTINTLIQGAWALLLGQHAGRDDVIYGVTVAGRPENLAAVDSTVGLFINTLPLRVQWADSPALVDWLQQLQHANSDLRHHAYLPLGKLKAMTRIAAEQALFDSILVFENFPVTDALNQDTGGLSFSAPASEQRADGITLTQGRNHFPAVADRDAGQTVALPDQLRPQPLQRRRGRGVVRTVARDSVGDDGASPVPGQRTRVAKPGRTPATVGTGVRRATAGTPGLPAPAFRTAGCRVPRTTGGTRSPGGTDLP
ncbi:condensation domain-containing protein [Pseudomonas corrugata]